VYKGIDARPDGPHARAIVRHMADKGYWNMKDKNIF
jgi:hypothetical protein